jgi:ribosome maturation factor RimP
LLDVHDLLPGHYSLEVSSPGLDRPLKRSADFERFVGQPAKVRMKLDAPRSKLGPQPIDPSAPPRRNFTGTIQGVSGDLVQFDAEGVGLLDLHIEEMERANLIYSF